jgi:formate hydrogenlyase subunit 4
VSTALPVPVIQLLQVLTIALAAPGVTGVIARMEARLQGRRGPRISQPYCDLAKLFRKEALAPEGASWFFLAAPVIAVMAYLTIPLLIPVLTSYGLPLGYMGDILGGGFLLSLVGGWRRCRTARARWSTSRHVMALLDRAAAAGR